MNEFDPRRLPKDKITELISRDVLEEVEEMPETKAVKPINKKLDIKIIKIIGLCLVGLAAITSVYFLYKWNVGARGPVLGMMIAVIMTGSQILLPELSIYLFMKKTKGSVVGGSVVAIFSIIATLFSVSATMGGLYDARTYDISSKRTSAIANSMAEASSISFALQSAKELREAEAISLKQYQEDERLYSGEVALAVGGNGKSSWSAESKRDLARDNIRKTTERISSLNKEIIRLSSSTLSIVKPRDDFYSWFGKRLWNTSPDTVEFAMSSFPAIFNEVIAPIVLAVVLFL